jgi:hypothetical protein
MSLSQHASKELAHFPLQASLSHVLAHPPTTLVRAGLPLVPFGNQRMLSFQKNPVSPGYILCSSHMLVRRKELFF